jgi:protein SCO1/2
LVFLFAIGIVVLQFWRNYTSNQPDLPVYGTVPPFSLTTEHHATFTNTNIEGTITIADFIFTTCAGPCPLMSAKMQQFQTTFQNESNVKLISFSVDPKQDTPEVLAEYGTRFGAKNDKWKFLTGDEHQMYDLTRKGFLLSVDADSESIAHSTKFVLIDRHATIRGYYDSEDDSSLMQLIHDVHTLLQQ